jgi:hypothetical protein
MSTNIINEIDRHYFVNKKLNNKNNLTESKKDKKDKYFYKKRIISLVKKLLDPEISENNLNNEISQDVEYAFNYFVKITVNYFKTIDKTDILQEEYKNLNNSNSEITINDKINTNNDTNFKDELEQFIGDDINAISELEDHMNMNKLFMRSINLNKNGTLDNFIKKTLVIKENEIILPQKKNINLKDPALKNKGIVKKKNISNKYETNEIQKETYDKEKEPNNKEKEPNNKEKKTNNKTKETNEKQSENIEK